MSTQWERPSLPSRRFRLAVFAIVALVVAVVVVSLILLAYTAVPGPATTG